MESNHWGSSPAAFNHKTFFTAVADS